MMLLLLVVKLLGLLLLIKFAAEIDMVFFNETTKRFTEYQNFSKVDMLFKSGSDTWGSSVCRTALKIIKRCQGESIDCNTVAIFRTSQGKFKIFDPHSRDLYGMPFG